MKWLNGCTLCNIGIAEEIEQKKSEGMSVRDACRVMAEQAAKEFPELTDDFSADRIRARYKYYMRVGEILPKKESEEIKKTIIDEVRKAVSGEIAEKISKGDCSPEVGKKMFEVIRKATQNTTAAKFTGDQESYTPAKYIESAKKVMGSIDVDPASNELADKIIKAGIFYTEEVNGLEYSWNGNVFLNPPYKHPTIKHFIDKLISEYQTGNTKQAILLTNNNTDTAWFHDVVKIAGIVCFTKGRISFYKYDGKETQPTNGQAFFYFGNKKEVFTVEFRKYGLVLNVND